MREEELGHNQKVEQVGPYQVLNEIARGGQGAVFRAKHLSLGTHVALKILTDPDETARHRFVQEAKTLARLRHPSLLRVEDLGELPDGRPYLAMEIVKGSNLAEWREVLGRPSVDKLLALLESLAETLHFCHEAGIVHRDLKPSNVMIEERTGRVLLVDFGLVKRDRLRLAWSTQDRPSLTDEGASLGTPSYMPPEQISSDYGEVGPRSDVYSLGGVLYFLLTGEKPFTGTSPINVLVKVMRSPPPDPRALDASVPQGLAELGLRCMSKDMDKRPASAQAFTDELRELCPTPSAEPDPAPEPSLRGLLALLCLAALAWLLYGGVSGETPSKQALPPTSPTSPASPSSPGLGEEPAASSTPRAAAKATPVSESAKVAGFREAAAKGELEAMFQLAYRLDRGQGVVRDSAQAFEWYSKCAARDDPRAMVNMGLILIAGRGVERDKGKATQWYARAAKLGNSAGMCNYAASLELGRGVIKDPALAVEWYRKAAEAGNAKAMARLAILLQYGQGVEANEEEALLWYRRAVEKTGEASAMFGLARFLSDGQGIHEDEVLALEWYLKAAAKGHRNSMFELARLHWYGRRGVPQDRIKGAEWYRRAAEKGHLPSMLGIGYALSKGEGVPLDAVKGAEWVRRAADQGHVRAMVRLGTMTLEGRGVAYDAAAAAEWFRKAAQADDAPGMVCYGQMLCDGKGLERDFAEAANWFRKAADRGHPAGQFQLGFLLERGLGVTRNKEEAVRLYRLAAKKEHAPAAAALKRLGLKD